MINTPPPEEVELDEILDAAINFKQASVDFAVEAELFGDNKAVLDTANVRLEQLKREAKQALLRWREAYADKARIAYEQKVQDFAIETYIHSKVTEWANQHNPYIGHEGLGYQTAQKDLLKLLPEWRKEISALRKQQEDK